MQRLTAACALQAVSMMKDRWEPPVDQRAADLREHVCDIAERVTQASDEAYEELETSRAELRARQQELAHVSLCAFASSAAKEFDELRTAVRDEVDTARTETELLKEEQHNTKQQLSE